MGLSLFNVILTRIIASVYDMVFVFFLNLAEVFTNTLLKPFTFVGNGYDVFAGAVGSGVMATLQDIAMGIGLSLSILFLLFSLLKVFYGRYGQDAPDPLKTCVRFIFAIIFVYWGSTLLFDYIFPYAQTFIDKVFKLQTVSFSESIKSLIMSQVYEAKSVLDNPVTGEKDVVVGLISTAVETKLQSDISPFNMIFELLALIICLIAVFINIFKIALENAERYFTTILLTIFAPVAGATLVNEKTSGVFKAWCQMLAANILTILFNVLGIRILIGVFANVATSLWNGKILSTDGLLGIIIVVAFSKMVQKMDQLLSQLTFKINPIQNRSLIMGALGTIGGLAKSGKAFSDMATGRGPLMNTINHFKNRNSADTKNPDTPVDPLKEKGKENANTDSKMKNANSAVAGLNKAADMNDDSAKAKVMGQVNQSAGFAGQEAMNKAMKAQPISSNFAIDRSNAGSKVGETGRIDLAQDFGNGIDGISGIDADAETLENAASQIVATMNPGERILPTETKDGFRVVDSRSVDYGKAVGGDKAVQQITTYLANGTNEMSKPKPRPKQNKR